MPTLTRWLLDPGVKTKEIKRWALGLRGLPTKFSVIPPGVDRTYVAETKREDQQIEGEEKKEIAAATAAEKKQLVGSRQASVSK